jgi:uncharacterized damage-inducible protein DinB
MITKKDLLTLMKKEFATTEKVLNAYPSDKHDFKPHEKSQEAIRLASTFVFEMYLLGIYLFTDELDRNKFKDYKPASMKEVIGDFKKETESVVERLEALDEGALNKTIEFGGTTFSAPDFTMMMIHDQIHHRGQLTVYVRMAGGLVPSIYGPSADDTSTNL